MSLVARIKNHFQPSGLLSYTELVELVNSGVIDAPLSAVNGSSIDVTLHHIARREAMGAAMQTVRLGKGETIETVEIDLHEEYRMMPYSTLLAATVETLNMPLWLSAEYSLKSSIGRNFLGHEMAGWCDPGFNGTLTLELRNNNSFKKLILTPGMPIGQLKFFRHKSVPHENSYAVRGQYMGQNKAQPSLGIK
jgi:dCTP deaminase